MTVINALCGALSDTSAKINAKVTTATGTVSVEVSSEGFSTSSVTTFGPVDTASQVGSVSLTGLSPNTDYQYRIIDNGTLDTAWVGSFSTLPAQSEQTTVTFCVSGDAGLAPEYPGNTGSVLAANRLSDHPVFRTIAEHPEQPRWFTLLGDWCYYDAGSGVHVPDSSLATYYRQVDDSLLQPNQIVLAKAMPWVYMCDDHDAGPNNSDSTSPGVANFQQMYRDRIPSYDLPSPSGSPYHSFRVGRTLFILSDTRTNRDPNSNPDGPGHTMLGESQVTWIMDTLQGTDAEFFVWLMPTPWLRDSSDGWGGFTTERDRLAAFLVSSGWSQRMVMLTADSHAHGIAEGPNNPYGGFPCYLVGSLDATPSALSEAVNYPDGFRASRNQYAMVDLDDQGSALEFRIRFYTGGEIWRAITHAYILEESPGGPEEPTEPEYDDAVRSKDVHWYLCNFRSGAKITELKGVKGEVSVALGQYTTTSLTLPVVLSGPGHIPNLEELIQPGQSMIVLVLNDQPVWGGQVTGIEYAGKALTVSCASIENYLNARYVQSRTFNNVDMYKIYQQILVDCAVEGVNFQLNIESVAGSKTTIEYADQDDVKVYRALGDLMAMDGGLEWTTELAWRPSRTGFTKAIRAARRIGEDRPNLVFRTKGREAMQYKYRRLFTEEYGGNHITYSGPGQGDSRPRAVERDNLLISNGWPRYERRLKDDVVSNVLVLAGKASAELARVRTGVVVWELTLRMDALTWGADWRLGDGASWVGHSNLHPNGKAGSGRIIGFKINPSEEKLIPTLLEV